MKVLILTDDEYAVIEQTATLPIRRRLKLPGAADLHELARNDDEPTAFTLARESLEAANAAVEHARGQMHDLIDDGHKLGVRPSVLQKWSGYSARRIFQITNEA